jgi:hypothetical protein
VARTIRLAAATPADRVATLRSELDELRTRRHLGYRESMEWATDAGTVIDEITATSHSAPSRELLKLVELAIGRVVKVILHADDSAGTIGDLARQLLGAHEQICDAGVADPKALAKWMVRFGFDDQDFFTVDPVRYAMALGDDGLTVLRRAVDDRSTAPDPAFAVRYTRERLAVLDGDIDRIVELLGGDLTGPHQFIRVAEAMIELGRGDDALAWARRGIESTSGWQVAKLYDIAADVIADRGDDVAVLDLRREQHHKMPSSSTYALLQRAAVATDTWDSVRASAREVLAARDVGGLIDALLADGDFDAAWDAASGADTADLGDQRWARLAEAREATEPAVALGVYLRLIDSTLQTADRRAYRSAAKQLKERRRQLQQPGCPKSSMSTWPPCANNIAAVQASSRFSTRRACGRRFWIEWPSENVADPQRQAKSKVKGMKRDLIERYRGRWVAVDESGDVVADADELGTLLERLAELGVTADTVQRVPGIGEPIFVGLS